MARICQLPECHVSYVPNRPWQKCCTIEHGRKLRYLRRKARLVDTVKLEITTPIKVDNPRTSVKVEGIRPVGHKGTDPY